MSGRTRAVRAGRGRGKVAALALAAGLAVPGALVALTPSTAGAASDPLGPTITQLETFYAAAAANTVGAYNQVYWNTWYILFGPFAVVPTVECLVTGILNPQPFGGPCGR